MNSSTHPGDALTMETLSVACSHLSEVDSKLAPLITQHGLPDRLVAKKKLSHFSSLAKAIIHQQLATKVASAIYERVLVATDCIETTLLTPECIIQAPVEILRGSGLSERKASYLKDLAQAFSTSTSTAAAVVAPVDDDETNDKKTKNRKTTAVIQSIKLTDELIDTMTDEELTTSLIAIKGIGPWTIDMHSMFAMGRPDILPLGDLGVRKGMQLLYGLKELPSPAEMEALAEIWRPYRSVGSFYMWKVGEMMGERKGGEKKRKKSG